MSEIFKGFDDDKLAENKFNGDYDADKLAGEVQPYDFDSHNNASHDSKFPYEDKLSFIHHWLNTN